MLSRLLCSLMLRISWTLTRMISYLVIVIFWEWTMRPWGLGLALCNKFGPCKWSLLGMLRGLAQGLPRMLPRVLGVGTQDGPGAPRESERARENTGEAKSAKRAQERPHNPSESHWALPGTLRRRRDGSRDSTGDTPETAPGLAPGTTPRTALGIVPETLPGTAPWTAPGTVSGTAPGTV